MNVTNGLHIECHNNQTQVSAIVHNVAEVSTQLSNMRVGTSTQP